MQDFMTALGAIGANTYTPEFSGFSNVQSVASDGIFSYLRIFDYVLVAFAVDVDPTAAGAAVYKFSLPIATNITDFRELKGVGVFNDNTTMNAFRIIGDEINNIAGVDFYADSGTARLHVGLCLYRISP